MLELLCILRIEDELHTPFGVCLGVLVEVLDATRVEGAGSAQNAMYLRENNHTSESTYATRTNTHVHTYTR